MADEHAKTINRSGNSQRGSLFIRNSTFIDCAGYGCSLRASQRLMKNQRFQSLGRYILFKCLAASFCLLLLCSCTSTVYDMRQLDQPVVLNNNPFLISRTVTSPKLVNVDTYSATVQNTVSGANDTTTTSTVNTAQLNAFLKIGGEPNYFIGNVTIDTEGQWANLLFLLFGTHAEIDATGEVAQIQAPLMRPPVGPSGQPTNQPALSSAVPK